MQRWMVLCVLGMLTTAALAAVEIAGVMDEPAERYDVSWTMKVTGAPNGVLALDVESENGQGYQLRWEKHVLSWQQVGLPATFAPVKAALELKPGMTMTLGIKRRQDTVAVLKDHRLLFMAPAPSRDTGTLAFSRVPGNCVIDEARCRQVGKPIFGDDFMRPEAARRIPTAATPWVEDDTWRIAYYRRDHPGEDPRDPATAAALTAPWQLSLFPTVDFTANGFWFLYRGVGPSWVVANQTMVYPTWDQYFVETAVKPEFDSSVGVIAAYQDNRNYLVFEWKPREYINTGATRAQLVAVVDGERRVLGNSRRGFEPGQWYTLRVNLGWKVVQVLVDGELIIDASNPGPIEGRVGLFADGAEKPRRPKLDDVTATMYVTTDETTGKVTNDAADALRTYSVILFDDVRVGEWNAYQSSLASSPYAIESTGKWKSFGDVSLASAPGKLLAGTTALGQYVASTRVRVPRNGSAGLLFHMTTADSGYAWIISTTGQKLLATSANGRSQEVDSANLGIKPGEWADLRVEADGPYVRLFFNNRKVLEHYDADRTAGRCGFMAFTKDVSFSPLTVTQHEPPRVMPQIRDRFAVDRWMAAWSVPEADWYPAFTPRAYVTPAGVSHDTVGAASPLPTDQPGLYWHKGGHFHDLTVTIPLGKEMIDGQILHLASDYDSVGGYRVQLVAEKDGQLFARLTRGKNLEGEYPFTLTQKARLVFLRRGSLLVLNVQELDPEQTDGDPEVLSEHRVFTYRDRAMLPAEMIGFTVTSPKLAAAHVQIESDRFEDTFEAAPAAWVAESGVWAVMQRYSCQPQWNWFGGYGAYTPTLWSKYRLDGDQVVEAYLAIKMQFDNAPEEYARRYRDTNLTICADGMHLNTGYTVVRAGRPNGRTVTMLLRKGVVVQQTTDQRFLLPPQGTGHRRWFATRIEKRGDTIKVFIDNRLAMTYQDPDPIPGGYAGVWTLNNGVMIGRANLSAARMSIGSPRAAAPLALQEQLEPLPVPKVTMNTLPLRISTFENGLDDVRERPGLTARLVRERVEQPSTGPNTYLKVVNMYPAGDFSVNLISSPVNLRTSPHLHLDYNFDPGAQVNLYVKRDTTWYEFLLTGKEASEQQVYTVGRLKAAADGQWRHLEVDLGTMLADAIARQTNTAASGVDLTVKEIVLADWSASSDARTYGFGNNPGGMAIRLDNIALVPALPTPAALGWQLAGASGWRTSLDSAPVSLPSAETTGTTTTYQNLAAGRYFFHLQAKDANGKLLPAIHIPLLISAPPGP